MAAPRALALIAALVVLSGACSADDVVTDPTIDLGTIPPTTVLTIPFQDTRGLPYCDVAKDEAAAIRVFSDSSTNYGDPDVVEQVYIQALVAFDGLRQVATREIETELSTLVATLTDAVDAASAVGWDLTQVSDDAGRGVKSTEMTQALATVREYTDQRCGVDIVGIEPPITTGPSESARERQLRVISETFPVLTDEQISCLAARLPLDFDPDSPGLDQDAVTNALLTCGIDPDSPSQPTTTTTTSPTETTEGN